MEKKQGNLKLVFLIFIIIELALVILSSSFNKKLEVGFIDGKFTIHNVDSHYDLQDKITEDFQRDEFLVKSTRIHLYEIPDFSKFAASINQSHPVSSKIISLLSSDMKKMLKINAESWTDDQKSRLINEINKNVISSKDFYQEDFKKYLVNDSSEKAYLIKKLSSDNNKLTNLDNSRVNRILIESVINKETLHRQENQPAIYGSFNLYNFFRNVFGEAAALSAFFLIRMLLIVDLLVLLIIILVKRTMSAQPSKGQIIMEMLYSTFEDFVKDTLGKERLHYTPYIVTIFIFIWLCNMIGLVPIPGFMEPTRNINVPLGIGIIAILVVHFTAIKVKGAWGHLQNYLNPIKNPMAALDIVSEVSKVVSISFRLFGNILGGAIIIVVVSSLVQYIVLPVGLNLFFGVFVGTVQAFVFTMLALTYIGVEISE